MNCTELNESIIVYHIVLYEHRSDVKLFFTQEQKNWNNIASQATTSETKALNVEPSFKKPLKDILHTFFLSS